MAVDDHNPQCSSATAMLIRLPSPVTVMVITHTSTAIPATVILITHTSAASPVTATSILLTVPATLVPVADTVTPPKQKSLLIADSLATTTMLMAPHPCQGWTPDHQCPTPHPNPGWPQAHQHPMSTASLSPVQVHPVTAKLQPIPMWVTDSFGWEFPQLTLKQYPVVYKEAPDMSFH